MAKISIHIPDETLVKVRQHKDRLNISKICSTALLKEVEMISDIPPLVQETQILIERLRKQTSSQHKESFDLGTKLATTYIKKITLDQLGYWGSLVFSEKKKMIFPEEIEDIIEQHTLDKTLTNRFHRPSFTKGWLSIMKRTWETVKDKIY